MFDFTICQNCGKLVHAAPGFCRICGETLGSVHICKPDSQQVGTLIVKAIRMSQRGKTAHPAESLVA